MNLKHSLYYRARSFVQKMEKEQILKKYEVPCSLDLPLEMIQAFPAILPYLKDVEVLLDVGAYKGNFTRTATAFFPFRKAYCFEPNSRYHPKIESISNPEVEVSGRALSDGEGEAPYYHHSDASMNSIIEAEPDILRKEFPWDEPDSMEEESITVSTLDTFLKERKEKGPFFLKIDTQGSELKILKGGKETLKQTKLCLVEHMFLSPYEDRYSFGELVDFFEDHGFTCRGPTSISQRPSGKISGADFLFSR